MSASKYNPIFEFEYMIRDQPYTLRVTSVRHSSRSISPVTHAFRYWAMSWAISSRTAAKIGNRLCSTHYIKVRLTIITIII